MKNSILTVFAYALLGLGTVAVADEHRLAGTIALGDGEFLAIIEIPSGEQQIFHVGDEFENGIVVSIAHSETRISTPAGEIVLSLEGKSSDVDSETSPGLVVASLELSDKQLQSVLALRGSEDKKLMAGLSESLALPEGLQVRHVMAASEEFDSLAAALPAIQLALGQGEAPHLFFEPGSGVDEIYLLRSDRTLAAGRE